MKYRDFYIDETETTDILGTTPDGEVHCNGICFQIYADYDYQIPIGEFTGAYGFEIGDSRESILQFVREHIDGNFEAYREKQFYSLIESDFKDFDYEIHYHPEEYDVLEGAEKISNMNKAHEYLMKHRPVKVGDMHHIVKLRRPLETICDYFTQDEQQFVKEFCSSISEVSRNKHSNYGFVSEYESEEEILDVDEAENEQENGMAMQ